MKEYLSKIKRFFKKEKEPEEGRAKFLWQFEEENGLKDRHLTLGENMQIASEVVNQLQAFNCLDIEERYYLVRSVEALIEELEKYHLRKPVQISGWKKEQ